jgi:hypothetical protein
MSVEGNVDLSRVRKKLEEAGFFLGKMSEQEQRLTGQRVPFDYYLSAFLSAGRTVDYRLCHEHKAIYKPWRKAWNARITRDENQWRDRAPIDRFSAAVVALVSTWSGSRRPL